jgi:hypothetical protein
VRLQPICYQDDVGTLCADAEMADDQADKLSDMIKTKALEAHPDKTGYLILGSKKYKTEQEDKIRQKPIKFEKFVLEQKTKYKYLGQVIKDNLAQSVIATIEDRQGKIKGAAIEVKSLIEDFTMQSIGGLVAAWELWEKALVPSLLSGAGTWLGVTKEAITMCDNIQNFFWRVVLDVPQSCPKVALQCETNMVGMKWRIFERKCLLLLQIQKLEEGVLARMVVEESDAKGWPGLAKEAREICEEINIPDINKYKTDVTKEMIKKAIAEMNNKAMMAEIEKSKKLDDIKNEEFTGIAEYFLDNNIQNARLKFKIRTHMVKHVPGNFKNKFRNKEDGLKCHYCTEIEMTQEHCVKCPGLEEMREGLDMSEMNDLVTFFKRYMKAESKK